MKILMFTWEFPPLIAGGLAMACYGMVKALLQSGIEVDLVLPTKDMVYFPLRKVEDADTLPVVFLDPIKHKEYERITHETLTKRLEYLGVSFSPETYINGSELKSWTKVVEKVVVEKHHHTTIQEKIWQDLKIYLLGEENIFKKVQELTVRAEKFAKTLDFDLIHSHDWLTYPAGMLAKRLTGKPLIAHMHATEFDRSGGVGDERIHNLEYDGMSYADRVICVSKYTANMVISRYHIDSGKIRIIHNAYDVGDLIADQKDRIFKGPTILFLGRITLQKGPDYFIEIANEVLKVHPHARFIMAGTGDMSRKLLHRSAFLRLRNRFIFAGFLNRKQVETILNSVDIYILPSVSEPFGIAPLEAMAYGVTAIISKQSGVSEVVNHAYKVDFWDTKKMSEIVNYLIENPDECQEMGEKGRLEVQSIGWSEAADKIISVYDEML
ncbi:MAG TPA: glycosyltransferase [Candidatus Cloacimonadota bacterium]|nr:glycosyltransferase [Candidatus Cloacimonadota bacterium]